MGKRAEDGSDESRAKRRGAVDLSTGSYISLVLLGRGWRGDVTRVEGVDRLKGAPSPSTSWAKNTNITECTVCKKWTSPVYALSSLWMRAQLSEVGGKTVHVVFKYLSRSLLCFPADSWIFHLKTT